MDLVPRKWRNGFPFVMAVEKMRRSSKPLLAAIRGTAAGGAMPFDEGLKIEYDTAVKLAGTKDFAEGIRAFLEKREPKWE